MLCFSREVIITQNRIKALRKHLGLTQADFGARLGLQGNTITNYETGTRVPGDAIIKSICREFNVSELWLRSGDGEMFQKLSPNQEIAEFLGAVMHDPEDSIRKRFIFIVSKLSVDEWTLLSNIAKKMAQDD